MKVRDYLNKLSGNPDVTFIITRAVKDDNTPFFHAEYRETPIWKAKDWLECINENLLDAIILNDNHPAFHWLCGVDWNIHIKGGSLKCMLIIYPEDMDKLFPGKAQQASMIRYIDTKLDRSCWQAVE